MSTMAQPERATQNRVLALFREELACLATGRTVWAMPTLRRACCRPGWPSAAPRRRRSAPRCCACAPKLGGLFVFVDECHRTQSGRLHRAMKALVPEAVFIGFTGTPLLKDDKQSSLEVFGGNIHTYRFSEAVEDEVVLDLVYEARDIDQRLVSPAKIDAWFDAHTENLNTRQKNELKAK